MGTAEGFGHRCQVESIRRWPPGKSLSVLGDWAEWIWALQGRLFVGAEGVQDILHAVEHLAELTRAAWGDGESSPA